MCYNLTLLPSLSIPVPLSPTNMCAATCDLLKLNALSNENTDCSKVSSLKSYSLKVYNITNFKYLLFYARAKKKQ